MDKYQKGSPRFGEAGQALLVIILVMVIALTVGLSVAIRTTTNIRTTTEEENSQRAFSAAEAGIERSLTTNPIAVNGSGATSTTYSTTVIQPSGVSFLLNNGTNVLKDEPVDLWLSTYPSYAAPWSGNLTINWGSASDVCTNSESANTQAALEIVLISGTKSSPTVNMYAFDPCSARAAQNKFQSVASGNYTISGKAFAYQATISVSSGLIARIIPLYASTTIGVKKGDSDPNLPVQGSVISSVGTSGNTKRKIVSFRGYPKLPVELFPFIIFSPSP